MADKLEPIRAVFRQCGLYNHAADDLLCELLAAAALDAARGEAVPDGYTSFGEFRWACDCDERMKREWIPLYAALDAAVPAANVTPMRQPRADLARLVESINAAVYANGDGLSVTEAIGALELAKLELLKEQEQ